MQAPVTDRVRHGAGRGVLPAAGHRRLPGPLLALAGARRAAERDRQALPPGSPLRGPAEWATPALTARALRLPLFNRREQFGAVRPPQAPVLAEGVIVREVGEFVGRRREMREARRALGSQKAGLVLHGIGGVGKSTLAAEVLRSLGERRRPVVSRAGQVLVDDMLGEAGARLQLAASAAEGGEGLARAGLTLRAADVEWADRWRLLAEQILPGLPMTVLLDNFEDNLHAADDGGGWQVRDPELAALLAGWARRPGRAGWCSPAGTRSRCRAGRAAAGRSSPGPVVGGRDPQADVAAARPGCPARRRQGPGLPRVGGHPRTLEYLDALLRGGQARFDDVAERMEDRLRDRGITDPAAWLARPGRDLDASLAEAVTLSVDDVVLSGLLEHLSATPVATELVTGASVYRIPVDDTALASRSASPPAAPRPRAPGPHPPGPAGHPRKPSNAPAAARSRWRTPG